MVISGHHKELQSVTHYPNGEIHLSYLSTDADIWESIGRLCKQGVQTGVQFGF